MKKPFNSFLVIFIIILLLGAYLRFNGINYLSFTGDEETTTLATMGIQENGIPHFPSGMHYFRSLLHTYLLHFVFQAFGVGELQARFPSLIFGIGTIFLMIYFSFLIYPNKYLALGVGVLTTLSCYQIEESRTARMYAPFIFFHLIFLIYVVRFYKFQKLKEIVLASLFFIFSTLCHVMSIFGLPFLAYQFFFIHSRKAKKYIFASVTLTGISWFVLYKFTKWPFRHFRLLNAIPEPNQVVDSTITLPIFSGIFLVISLFFLIIFLILLQRKFEVKKLFVLIPVFVLFTLGFTHLAWLLLFILFIIREKITSQIIFTAIFGFITTIFHVSEIFFQSYSLVETVKTVFSFPYLTEIYFLRNFPVFLMSLLVFVVFVIREKQNLLKIILLQVLSVMIILSFFKSEFFYRYLAFMTPFMLLIYGFLLYRIFTSKIKTIFKYPLIAIGLIAVFLEVSPPKYFFPLFNATYGDPMITTSHGRPDHKGAALFVKNRIKPDDIVISIDALETYYYLGKADYWLRKESDIERFLYLSKDLLYRDVYVNSRKISNIKKLKNIISQHNTSWIIDSGETFLQAYNKKDDWLRNYYLPKEINRFIDNSKRNLVYLGMDKHTNVYKYVKN